MSLTPEQLAALSARLQQLIDDAKDIQKTIAERSDDERRKNQPDRRGQPTGTERVTQNIKRRSQRSATADMPARRDCGD